MPKSKSLIFNYYNNLVNKHRESITDCSQDTGLPEQYLLFQSALKEFQKKKLMKIIQMDYEQGNIMKEIKEIEDKTKISLLQNRADKRLDRYIFLTISPPDNIIKPEEFLKMCHKAMSRKFIVKYHFVIEQRGMSIEESGKGMHAHLLFERNVHYKPAVIKRDLKNTFKKCYKKINDHNYNFKKCGKEFYTKRLEYIKGKKTEEGKDLKMEIDKHFRNKYKISEIYEN